MKDEKNTKSNNPISDAAITSAIKAKYLMEPKVKVLAIHVETSNGVVTLTGEVPDDDVLSKAVAIAEETDGVKQVECKLKKEDL